MTVRDMKKEREYTLKHHLIVFLLYVIGSMLCLNVFTLLFGMDNNRRNRSAAENINLLNDYSVIMEDVMENCVNIPNIVLKTKRIISR